jgi:hypothetical protein
MTILAYILTWGMNPNFKIYGNNYLKLGKKIYQKFF